MEYLFEIEFQPEKEDMQSWRFATNGKLVSNQHMKDSSEVWSLNHMKGHGRLGHRQNVGFLFG
jgi:hypothetical protein